MEKCNQERRPKYFELVDATTSLLGARLALQKLCDDICGIKEVPSSSAKTETTKEPVCLLEVLDYTPSQIQEEVKMINDAISEIRAQIL